MGILYGQDKHGRPVGIERIGDEVYLDGEQVLSTYYAGGWATLESATKSATIEKHRFTALGQGEGPRTVPASAAPQQARGIPDDAFRTPGRLVDWYPYDDGYRVRPYNPDDAYKT